MLRPWGTQYTPDIPRGGDWCCEKCFWPIEDEDNWDKFIVGVTKECPSSNWTWAVVIECPKCHEKLWFHIASDVLKFKAPEIYRQCTVKEGDVNGQ